MIEVESAYSILYLFSAKKNKRIHLASESNGQ